MWRRESENCQRPITFYHYCTTETVSGRLAGTHVSIIALALNKLISFPSLSNLGTREPTRWRFECLHLFGRLVVNQTCENPYPQLPCWAVSITDVPAQMSGAAWLISASPCLVCTCTACIIVYR